MYHTKRGFAIQVGVNDHACGAIQADCTLVKLPGHIHPKALPLHACTFSKVLVLGLINLQACINKCYVILLQGSASSVRRNYTGLFADIAEAIELVDNPRFELQLFSSSLLDTENLTDAIRQKTIHKSLSYMVRAFTFQPRQTLMAWGCATYTHLRSMANDVIVAVMLQDFYSEMHKSLALLTLFPGSRYYRDAASSTVATAICSQVPLIAEPEFAEVYSFIPRGALVISNTTNHAVALQKVLQMQPQDWNELAMQVWPNFSKACRKLDHP